jgi:hypothetical protein
MDKIIPTNVLMSVSITHMSLNSNNKEYVFDNVQLIMSKIIFQDFVSSNALITHILILNIVCLTVLQDTHYKIQIYVQIVVQFHFIRTQQHLNVY